MVQRIITGNNASQNSNFLSEIGCSHYMLFSEEWKEKVLDLMPRMDKLPY